MLISCIGIFIKLRDCFIIEELVKDIAYIISWFLCIWRSGIMSLERIPVSLKVDTESDFFIELLGPLRDSRGLSEFILGLMKAYHEDLALRDLVDNYNNQNSSSAALARQIERITVEHQKSVALTSMVASQVGMTMNVASGGADNTPQLPSATSENVVLNERLSSLEGKLEAILKFMDTSGAIETASAKHPSEGSYEAISSTPVTKDETAQIPSQPIQSTIVKEEVVVSQPQPAVNTAPIISEPVINTPSAIPAVENYSPAGVPPIPESIAPTISAETPEPAPVRKAPASFGKAKSSINKK